MQRRTFVTTSTALAMSLAMTGRLLAAGRKGSFKGASGHTTTGGVTLKDGVITLESDFSLDGAPDPRIGLGNKGKYAANTDFAVLKSNTGEQAYKIPANLNPADYDTVFIWCRKYSVPLGHARLK